MAASAMRCRLVQLGAYRLKIHAIAYNRSRNVPARSSPTERSDLAISQPPDSAKASTTPSSSSTSKLINEALLQTLQAETTTSKDILGEDTLEKLKQALGEKRAGQLIGAMDGLLANRRAATLLFAVLDVALIWVLIRVFRTAAAHD